MHRFYSKRQNESALKVYVIVCSLEIEGITLYVANTMLSSCVTETPTAAVPIRH